MMTFKKETREPPSTTECALCSKEIQKRYANEIGTDYTLKSTAQGAQQYTVPRYRTYAHPECIRNLFEGAEQDHCAFCGTSKFGVLSDKIGAVYERGTYFDIPYANEELESRVCLDCAKTELGYSPPIYRRLWWILNGVLKIGSQQSGFLSG